VANVQHYYLLPPLDDGVEKSINIGLAAVQELSQRTFLGRRWASVGLLFEAQDFLLKALIPIPGSLGGGGVDAAIQIGKIALGTEVMLTR
jgi:hypothetical protein